MKKIFFIIILSFVNMLLLYSQNNKYLSPVIPPSPTSAIFNRYGDHQPSLSSGTINIPISIYELKVGEFKLPFTLQYNTSGINIQDRPYPCGYGWVFSPGLRITRTIFGRADDFYSMRSIGPNICSNDESCFDLCKRGIMSDEQYYNEHGLTPSDLIDTQHDIFTLHLPNGNYSFLLKNTGNSYETISIGHSLKIEFQNVAWGISRFIVTDENGIVYKFGNLEGQATNPIYEQSCEYSATSSYSLATAWVLREIILPNNTVIKLTWGSYVYNNNYTPNVSTPINITDYKSILVGGEDQYDISDMGGIVNLNTYQNILMLKKVEFPSGEINISYKSGNDPFITKFEVKNKNNFICKTVDFLYRESVLLDFLKIDKDIYKFTYNTKRYYKNTTGLDYWGYYNGKNNYDLIPNMRIALYNNMTYNQYPMAPYNIGSADRSVDNEFIKAYMLERIDYPTGGYSAFEYEPHEFEPQSPLSTYAFSTMPDPISKGGGLRVTKITSKAEANSPAIIKTYKYGTSENRLANVSFIPTLDTFIDEFCAALYLEDAFSYPYYYSQRHMSINALSNYSQYLIRNNPIWYSHVAEYVNDNKTEYTFEYNPDEMQTFDLYRVIKRPYIGQYRSLFNNGPRLVKQTVYKKKGQTYSPVEETLSNYEEIVDTNKTIENWIIKRSAVKTFSQTQPNGLDFRSYTPPVNINTLLVGASMGYDRYLYKILLSYSRLKSKQTVSVMDNGSNVTTTEEYTYCNTKDSQIQKIRKTTSKASEKRIEEYKYPRDYTDAVYITMVNKNMTAPVVEQISYGGTNGTLEIKRVKTNYTNTPAITNGLIRPASIQTSSSGIGNLQTEVKFDKYDAQGNLLQATLKDRTTQSYLWSYSYQYPIAEIRNATYAQIEAALGQALIDRVAYASVPSDADMSAINALRNNTSTLKDIQITTYTYKALVGMLTSTDPSGITTYYDYDSFGRLKETYIYKDNIVSTANKQIIQSYKYHYQNQ